jgi:hypothetical protein
MHRSHCRLFAAVGIALGAPEMAMANDERERERQEAYCAALSTPPGEGFIEQTWRRRRPLVPNLWSG